jgi:serine/threonine-protein kinase
MTQPRLLGGRYQVGDTLGYGGMAEVHHGRDVRLGREVAIKVLRADLARDPSFQARFRREAQAAAALNHPSIVAVYDTGEESSAPGRNGHAPYIVMEYVDGRTLRDVLKQEGRLHPQRAMEVAADICSALEFSHRTGIVHRDIKPGNVMITRSGAIKVMDFGIARAVADNAATVTSTQAVIGTAQYLSPEQARGEKVDARSDVYSLGCLLYELMTGGPPFTGDSPVAVAYQHVRENAVPPSQHNRDVPPGVDAIVMKALAKNPLNRYQSAGEMRADLMRAMAGRTVQAEPVMSEEERTTVMGATRTQRAGALPSSYPPPVAEERGNRRAMAFVLLGLAVLAVVVVAALVIMNLLKPAPPPPQVGVPDVTNQSEAAARQLLTSQGFTVAPTNYQTLPLNRRALDGKVLSQDPAAHSMVASGATVRLTVGQAPKTATVPDVTKYPSYDEARTALKALGFGVQPVRMNSDKPEGTILGSSPPASTEAKIGTLVAIQLSNGKSGMPNVVGKTTDNAKGFLDAQGYTNVQVQEAAPSDGTDFASGRVWKTDPAADTFVTKDQKIVLYVVPEKPTQTPSPSPTITNIQPNSGPAAGGTEVTIEGTDLDSVTGVTFGGVTGVNFQVQGNKITVTTPAHAPGTVTITLVRAAGNVPAENAFTYGP